MADKTLPKGYEPRDVEQRWSAFWEERNAFTPKDPETPDAGAPYAIVIPPPNVTGALHMGHALNLTVQDILCRRRRQLGDNVLWVPGMDHAGIATQNVVERKLAAEGVSRQDLGRERFIEEVWKWKEEYGGKILNQIRRMGASVDWSRERFTYDEQLSRAVREVFVQLYDEKLIYKGDYIINWCNRCHTALADDEVEYAPKQGKLTLIRYPYADVPEEAAAGEGLPEIVVATTRPETMLGDMAVAVNPEDDRYRKAIGRMVKLPLTNREIPVIGDKYVDMDFGTGCLKITPAHDPNDFELGRIHELETLAVIDEDGMMNQAAGEQFIGMPKEAARKKVVSELKQRGLLVEQQAYDHNVGHCYRCKSVIEPHVSTQWFVKVGPLAAKAKAAVAEGETRILPENWVKVYDHWLDNIRDWCISRQLWWGHRIPAWTCQTCGSMHVLREDPDACPDCGGPLTQDEDVLDTWFSSALWPFSTLGWPEKTKDLETFYPTSVLVTAFDILFFWVARMMMMGIHFMGQVPFRDVYIHALVRDAEGKKMSKSVGNVIDPIEMIDRFGCDSLRFTLAAFAAMGRDIRLSEDRIEGYRHFVNKIWNAARFTLMNLPETMPPDAQERPLPAPAHHGWIFHRLEAVKADVHDALERYHFNEAAQALYQFIWHELCDWYLEMCKSELGGEDAQAREEAQIALWKALAETLVLLHPFMPFVTQEIWSALPSIEEENLAAAQCPPARPERDNPNAAAAMEVVQQVVTAVRNIRGELTIAPSRKLTLLIKPSDAQIVEIIEANRVMIMTLARLESMELEADIIPPKAAASAVVHGAECFVPFAGAIDFDAELARLDKEINKLDKELGVVNKKLANEGFVAKAPADVVAKEKEKAETLGDKRDKLAELKDRLAAAKAEG